MPKKDVIVNLPSFAIQKVTAGNPVVLHVHYRKQARCPHCQGKRLRKKASYWRVVKHEPLGSRQLRLRFKAYKFYCRACGRYFNQRFPGILKYQRASEHLHRHVYRLHTQGVSQKTLAEDFQLGKGTVERWYQRVYQQAHQEQVNRPCPRVLGIDEHFFSRKQGYATTLCDLRKHKVFDMILGRASKDVASYFQQLPGKEWVKVVCMDLSNPYRSLVRHYFPKALIVADRFHVIRLINQLCLQTYQQLDPKIKYQRGLLSVLRQKPERLSAKQQTKRENYFKQQPMISAIDDFKQRLHRLLMKKTCTAKRCKRLIPIFLNYLEQLRKAPFKPLVTLGKTLYQWREAIVRMWRFTKSNGITEGFHRKMKLIQRRAYGFKNFENYRLRVRVLCS